MELLEEVELQEEAHHLITVENGWPMFSVGAEVLAQISESEWGNISV